MNIDAGFVHYQNLMPLHKHKKFEVIFYLRGNATVYVSEERFSIKAGNILILLPGVIHSTIEATDLQSIYIHGDFDDLLCLDQPVLLADSTEKEGATLAEMIYRNRYDHGEYLSALCNALMHFLMRNLSSEDEISLAVRKIIYEITESFHDPDIVLNELLHRSGYAEDYVRAHFKRITGKTPTAFLHDLRLKHACYLIETFHSTIPLTEIAVRCGYTDYVLFSKKFKTVTGLSPRKYKDSLKLI